MPELPRDVQARARLRAWRFERLKLARHVIGNYPPASVRRQRSPPANRESCVRPRIDTACVNRNHVGKVAHPHWHVAAFDIAAIAELAVAVESPRPNGSVALQRQAVVADCTANRHHIAQIAHRRSRYRLSSAMRAARACLRWAPAPSTRCLRRISQCRISLSRRIGRAPTAWMSRGTARRPCGAPGSGFGCALPVFGTLRGRGRAECPCHSHPGTWRVDPGHHRSRLPRRPTSVAIGELYHITASPSTARKLLSAAGSESSQGGGGNAPLFPSEVSPLFLWCPEVSGFGPRSSPPPAWHAKSFSPPPSLRGSHDAGRRGFPALRRVGAV